MAEPTSTFTAPTPLTVSAGQARASTLPSSSDSQTTTPTSTSSGRKRGVSLTQSILDAKAPPGIWAAMGEEIARGPGLAELRRLSSGSIQTRRGLGRRRSSATTMPSSPTSPTTHSRLGSINQSGDEKENKRLSVVKSTNYAQLAGSGSGGATTTTMLLPETGILQGQQPQEQQASIITAPQQAQFPSQQGHGIPGPSSSTQSPISPPISPLSFQFSETDDITVLRPNNHNDETEYEFKTPPASPTNTTNTATERRTKAKGSLFFEELEETPSIESDLRRKNTRRVKGLIVGTGAGTSIRESIGGGRPSSPEVMSRGGIFAGQEEGRGSAISVLEIEKPVVPVSAPMTGSILSMPPVQSPDFMQEKTEPPLQRALSDASSTPDRSVSTIDVNNAPEKKPGWLKVTGTGLAKFFWWFLTPMGFFITIYMANIIAWGGMLFLLLVNAAPAMCKANNGNCNHIDSPRRIWVEIDSQILNALFCVTGFGLIPWRFRDAYYLLQHRVKHSAHHLDKLAAVHEGWFQPTRGTKMWKLDVVVWLYVANTFLQGALSGLMWGMTRYDRPAWATGLLVALACGVAGGAGGVVWWEGRRLKKLDEQEKGARTDDEEAGMVARVKRDEGVEMGLVEEEHKKGKEVLRGDSGMAEKGVSRGGTDLSKASTAGEMLSGGALMMM